MKVEVEQLRGKAQTKDRGIRTFLQVVDEVYLIEDDGNRIKVAVVGRHEGAAVIFVVSNMPDELRQRVLNTVIKVREKDLEEARKKNPNAPSMTPSKVLTAGLPDADQLEEAYEEIESQREARTVELEGEGPAPELDEEREPA